MRHLRGGRGVGALAVAVAAGVLALGGAANAAPDSKGTDYWLMFPGNVATPTLSLFVASDVATTGTVEIAGLPSIPFSVAVGGVTTVPIPATAEVTSVDTVEAKGIHVIAEDEVTVYGLSQAPATTDAFLGLPTDVLGDEYVVLGYGNRSITPTPASQFGVVATQDGTTVTITPTVGTPDHPGGTPYTVPLDAGDTYQLRSTAVLTDLSGTTVTSEGGPIAVFGGHQCANVPPAFVSCNYLVEQLPATDNWGESFVTTPLANRSGGDTFRFLAATADTEVTVNGTLVATLAAGAVHEQVIAGRAEIEASAPILVAQYSNSSTVDNITSFADPSMLLVPPSEQFLTGYTVTTPAAGFSTNFVNVIAPTAATVTLDGVPIPAASFTPIGASGFSGAQVAVAVGSHRLQGSLPFGVSAYGFSTFDAYGYPGGFSFAPIPVVSAVSLAPPEATNVVGEQHCVTATVTDQSQAPFVGATVSFSVTGAHTTSGSETTGANGEALFCYIGASTGDDTITASVAGFTDTAIKHWNQTPAVATTLSLTPAEDTNTVGEEHCVVAAIDDQRGDPFPAAEVSFVVTGDNPTLGTDATDADGEADFCYRGSNVGDDLITATHLLLSDTATKHWNQTPAVATTLSLTPPEDTNTVGEEHCVVAAIDDQRGDPFPGAEVSFVVTGDNAAMGTDTTDADGEADFCYRGTNVGDDLITATHAQLSDTATKTWAPAPEEDEVVLLVLDEDGLGGKKHFKGKPGDLLTVSTGQAGDEGWFAPNCIPRKWLFGSSNECLDGEDRQTAIDNYVGKNGAGAVPKQSKLDKVPAVMPLRALGLTSLVGQDVCAVAYDSDVSVNYDKAFPFTDANLQGKTKGLVAFHVVAALGRNVTLRLLETTVCDDWVLFNAPVPRSSSVPDDRRSAFPDIGENGYLQLFIRPEELLFY